MVVPGSASLLSSSIITNNNNGMMMMSPDKVVFGSQVVSKASPTPYSDATQVKFYNFLLILKVFEKNVK